MKTGVIFDLKQFAIFDGPGIRQTVFLKGCPLRCNWCHNPEGFDISPCMLVSSGCVNCGKCVAVCKNSPCTACGECIRACRAGLRKIAGTRMTPERLADLILEDSDYYASCDVRLTFSAGEPLFQADFMLETIGILDGARSGTNNGARNRIHKAIETSAYADKEIFIKTVAAFDYIMVDIKHFNSEEHKKYTGAGNELILENIQSLFSGGKPFVVRLPVIPGVNDSDENYEAVARFLAKAECLVRIEFLPYHKTAGAKYAMTGRKYTPMFDVDIEPHISDEIFSSYGIRSVRL